MDKRLSLKGKGLLCQLLSLPDDWEFSEKGLVAIVKDGSTSLRSALEELEKCSKLRIIIDSDITEEKYNNLKACSYDNNNLFLYKRMRGLSKKEDDEKNKVLEEHRKERRALIEKYSKMDFYEITKSFIKDKYSIEVSTDEIKEAIA